MKGAPYSAEVIVESSQTLADGNRINRKTDGRVYRDSEGRTRREEDVMLRTFTGTANAGGFVPGVRTTISIVDPVAGFSYSLDPERKIAWRTTIGGANAIMGKVEAIEDRRRGAQGRDREKLASEGGRRRRASKAAPTSRRRRRPRPAPRWRAAAVAAVMAAAVRWWPVAVAAAGRRPGRRRGARHAARAQDDRRGRGRGAQDDHGDPGGAGRQRAADHHHVGGMALARARPARAHEAHRTRAAANPSTGCRTSSAPSPISRSSWCRPTTPSGRPASARMEEVVRKH